MKISLTMDEAEWTLIALDGYAALFSPPDTPEDKVILAEIIQVMKKFIKQIPAERMPKIRMVPHDREWNMKMHGKDVVGNLGKPEAWRIHKEKAAA